MNKRRLGSNGLAVSAVGVGCMTISTKPEDRSDAVAVLRGAVERGAATRSWMPPTAVVSGCSLRALKARVSDVVPARRAPHPADRSGVEGELGRSPCVRPAARTTLVAR
jgi:hypothetical protein